MRLTSSVVHERHMDNIFPWKTLVPEHLAVRIATILTGTVADAGEYPQGSSFSCVAGVNTPGRRLMHFSHASRDRLMKLIEAGELDPDIEIHQTFEDGENDYE